MAMVGGTVKSDLQMTQQERSVLRWGGLAGILGGIIYIVVFVIVGVFVGSDPAGLAGPVMRFPAIRAARIVENSLFLVVQILWVAHFLALYIALRGARLAPALFGSVISILGLVVIAAEALPHIAQAPISDLYHAPGATPGDQATLVLLWQATQGILDSLLVVGLLLLPLGVIFLGVAMLGAPAIGKGLGGASVVLGALGALAAVVVVVDPGSSFAVVSVFALIIFNFVVGWKLYRLSRGS